jgi:hypothetical protein
LDWNSAIERRRVPLLGHVLELFAKIGLTEGVTIERVSKPLHRQVLGILRTAESAVRRLIVAAARDIVVEYKPRRPASTGPKVPRTSTGEPKRKRRPLFGLFDPLKRFRHRFKKKRRPQPPIQIVDVGNNPLIPLYLVFRQQEPAPAAAVDKVDDGMVSAKHLVRRLLAAVDALQDIPRHAMRLARLQARPIEERRPERWSPLRPGRPPGFRQRAKHEVDEILKECDWLARLGSPPLDDTS